MQKEYEALYGELADDLLRIHQLELPEEKIIELCFKCSVKYWHKLKGLIKTYDFEDEMEEIQFLKYEKPQFSGLIEYYIQCYRALLFMPEKDNEEKKNFWENELYKIDRFYATHDSFYQYYKSGTADQDHYWFLAQRGAEGNSGNAGLYNADSDTVTSYDWLTRLIVAYEKYREYIYEQLNAIKKQEH